MKYPKRPAEIICLLIFTLILFAAAGRSDVFAVGETSREDFPVSAGITESTVYVSVDGGYNVRTHIIRIAPNAGASFKASLAGYYGADTDAANRKENAGDHDGGWGFESVRDQAADYEASPDTSGSVIVASNGDFFDTYSGEPEGCLVIEGNIVRKTKERPFFAVLKNGKIVIRKAGGKLKDVAEAVGGRDIIVWNGKTIDASDGLRNPRAAIGICKDGTIVIINIDGREPASAGVTMLELSDIMKAQGCTKALNFDGGGSASLLTRRADEDELVFRSNHSDGPERRVASSLLVIRDDTDSETEYVDNIVKMNSSRTCLKKNGKGVYFYRINGKKKTGFYAVNGESYLFSSGKGVTGDIKIGKTVYSFEKGLLTNCSDGEAGHVIIGYCGGSRTGTNLLYAYHYGNKMLNIGLNPRLKKKNGSMKKWTGESILDIPWYAVRTEVKKVYLANGVRNIGGYFLYSAKFKLPGGAKAPVCRLKSIRMPSSLKEIGEYSLYNKSKLSAVTIPSGVRRIGKSAFKYSGRKTLRFKGKTPPAFGSAALKKTGFSTVYVKRSKAWVKFVKNKKFRKYGYKKTVKYK